MTYRNYQSPQSCGSSRIFLKRLWWWGRSGRSSGNQALLLLLLLFIIIINVLSVINCFLHSPRTGANPWSWGIRDVFYLMDRNLLSMCAVPRRMIFYSSSMLLAPRIFPKFWFIPSQRTNNNRHRLCPNSPHSRSSVSRSLYFESFSMTFVEVFRSDGTDTSISLQHRKPGFIIIRSLLLLLLKNLRIDGVQHHMPYQYFSISWLTAKCRKIIFFIWACWKSSKSVLNVLRRLRDAANG